MYKKILLITFTTGLLLAGCDKDDLSPQACLMVDNAYPAVGEFITFNDCSEDAYRIEINFGDGSFAKYAPAEHSYNKKGT